MLKTVPKCLEERREKRGKRVPVLTVMEDEVGAQMSKLITFPLKSKTLFEGSYHLLFWNTVSDIGLYLLIQIKHFSNNKKEQVVPAIWQGNKGTKRFCCCFAEEIKSGCLRLLLQNTIYRKTKGVVSIDSNEKIILHKKYWKGGVFVYKSTIFFRDF